MSAAPQHRDVQPLDKAKYERLEHLAGMIIKYAAANGITPAEAKKHIVSAAKEAQEERAVDARPGALKLARKLKITPEEATDLLLRMKLSDADQDVVTLSITRQLEVDGPKFASLFALQGLFSLADAQAAVMRMREQHRADPGGVVTMSHGGRWVDQDPAAWAAHVSRVTGRPLAEVQAEAVRLRAGAASQPPPGATARIEYARQHQIEDAAREAIELTRRGWTLESAQAEVLRRRAAAPPPPPPPPPAPPAGPPQWALPASAASAAASAAQLQRGLRAKEACEEAERRHRTRGGR